MKRLPIFITLFLLCHTISTAQRSATGNWNCLNLQMNFSKRIFLFTDLNDRNYALFNDLEQGLLRTTLNYQLIPNQLIAGAGAAFIHNESYRSGSDRKYISQERRLHQQLQFRHQAGPLFISHRYRFEQRFFSNRRLLRLRYQLAVLAPLNKKELSKGTLYATFMNEIFLHTTTPLYDRNRIAFGSGYVVNPSLRVDLALMWQVLETRRRPQTLLTISKTIDFTR